MWERVIMKPLYIHLSRYPCFASPGIACCAYPGIACCARQASQATLAWWWGGVKKGKRSKQASKVPHMKTRLIVSCLIHLGQHIFAEGGLLSHKGQLYARRCVFSSKKVVGHVAPVQGRARVHARYA